MVHAENGGAAHAEEGGVVHAEEGEWCMLRSGEWHMQEGFDLSDVELGNSFKLKSIAVINTHTSNLREAKFILPLGFRGSGPSWQLECV